MPGVNPPDEGDNWLGLTDQELPIAGAYEWVVLPSCGAVVLFSGTVRNHAEGRDDVRVVVQDPKPISTVEVREVGPDDTAYYEK